MKKALVLIALLLLSACGAGGGSTTSSESYIDAASVPSSTLKLTIAAGSTTAPGKTSGGFTPTFDSFDPSNRFRIVMRNNLVRQNGEPYSQIQDVPPGGSLTLSSVPAANGYTVEALAYNTDPATGLNTVLSYAIASNVAVDASGNSTTALSLYPVSAAVVPPASVVQGAPYNVYANFSTAAGRRATPLHSSWFLNTPKTTSFAPFVNRTSATVFASYHAYNAPITAGVPTQLYFQGVFTVKPALLYPGESAKRWIFNAPEVSMPVTAPINFTIIVPDF